MSTRSRAVQTAILVALGVTLIVTAVATGRPLSSGSGSIVVGLVLLTGAGFLAAKPARQRYQRFRDVRRGIRQIESVLRLEAALTTRRLTVGGAPGGCPICGAPAGPHCVCRKH
ncbi:MAG: hypothetical protein ACRDV3_05745 [Acidothermaceae bacterium]